MSGRLLPRLIINADDLGIHPSIDAGIFEAFERGILTSATLLVTTPYTEAAVEGAKRIGLPIGLHFSLTLGRALAPREEVPDLVDAEGNLHLSARKLLLLGPRGGRDEPLYRQIEREMEAQFAAATKRGALLTHADSHQHVHMNPRIFSMLEDAAERHSVRRLRLPREPFFAFGLGRDLMVNLRRNNPAKLAMVRYLGRRITPRLSTNDRFFGLMYSGHVTSSAFTGLLRRVARANAVYELGLHPGHCAPADVQIYTRPGYNAFISSPSREAELRLLTSSDARDLVKRLCVRLISYADFDGADTSRTG